MMNSAFCGVAELSPLVRQKCYSSQSLKTEEMNEVYNWVSYCRKDVEYWKGQGS